MANVLVENQSLQDIADAIRIKNDLSTTYTPSQMNEEILKNISPLPTYYQNEAFEVIKKINNKKTATSLVFACVSDIHMDTSGTLSPQQAISLRHSGFAMDSIANIVGCDFTAFLGDLISANGFASTTSADGDYANNVLMSSRDKTNMFYLVGNHDQSDDVNATWKYIGQYNTFDVTGTTPKRCYGYFEVASKKVRVICLNTTDYLNGTGGYGMSYEQKDFFIRALDLSSKSDASSWKILILSHFPLDFNNTQYNITTQINSIINAYNNGTSLSLAVDTSNAYIYDETASSVQALSTYSNGALVYNYSGKNSAKITVNIHGHLHNDCYGKMTNNIWRISTPNTCFHLGKGNAYTDNGNYNATLIPRTINTNTDTIATFYVIDMLNETVYSIPYGAGNDRTIEYAEETIYTITKNLTNCVSSNSANSIVEGESFTTTITPNSGYTISSITCSMSGSFILPDSNNTITISSVTGNIVITASASAASISQVVTDLVLSQRCAWDTYTTSGTPPINSSNSECALAVSTTNSYSATDRNSNTRYMIPVPSQATKLTVFLSDTTQQENTIFDYLGYKVVSGTLTRIIRNKGVANGTPQTFTAGEIDYIVVNARHSDLSSYDWSYASSNFQLTFSN